MKIAGLSAAVTGGASGLGGAKPGRVEIFDSEDVE